MFIYYFLRRLLKIAPIEPPTAVKPPTAGSIPNPALVCANLVGLFALATGDLATGALTVGATVLPVLAATEPVPTSVPPVLVVKAKLIVY